MSHPVTTQELFYSPLGTDPDVCELVDLFIASLPQRISQLERAFTQQDWASFRQSAHQLKGAAGSYGFPQLTPILAQLESLKCESIDPREIESVLFALRDTSARMRPGMPPRDVSSMLCD